MEVAKAVHLVGRAVGKRRVSLERPSLLAQPGNRIGDADRALQLLQGEKDQRAVRPWAVPRHVEVITAGLRLVAGAAVGGNAVAKCAFDALEVAARAGLLRQFLVLAPAAVDQDAHAISFTCGHGSISSLSNGARSSGRIRSRSSFVTDARARMRPYHSPIRGSRCHMCCRRRRSSRRMYGITAASASDN